MKSTTKSSAKKAQVVTTTEETTALSVAKQFTQDDIPSLLEQVKAKITDGNYRYQKSICFINTKDLEFFEDEKVWVVEDYELLLKKKHGNNKI